ncbi:galactose oxidase-like [Hibiscus syriacus]|uniref:Galactose oxidase-like n=1 Tax=Hibiscus syriacus TaxID=106335 RepID=A0A6A3CKB4_HIBSY|nr:galactose oxidase-like [Hibiscus syriacus]
MSATEVEKVVDEEEKKGGELVFCGSTCWDIFGRRKGPVEGNLVSPIRLRPLVGVNIRFVVSGCGQLGHEDTIQRDMPTFVSELSEYNIIKAGSGRSHTVIVTKDGNSLAFGWNKHGQLGSGSTKNAGLPQYGRLGHGTDNEYNSNDSSVKPLYEAQSRPRAIATLSGETIVKVACGTNHTVAADKNGYVYTWGFGGYGRSVTTFTPLLTSYRYSIMCLDTEQKDEWVPRRVDVFQKHNVLLMQLFLLVL